MPPKMIIFTGAPDPLSSANSFSAALSSHFIEPFCSFLGKPPPAAASSSALQTNISSWRSLSLVQRPLVGASLPGREYYDLVHHPPVPDGFRPDNDFFSTASISFDNTTSTGSDPSHLEEENQRLLSQFYDHSLALHEDIPSSQLPAASLAHAANPTSEGVPSTLSADDSTSTFNNTTLSMDSRPDLSHQSIRPPLTAAHLSDLEDIPPAAHLLSLAPQTVTVNIIVGVLSVSTPRTVVTRWGSQRALIEVLLADETRSGFNVTFWLPPASLLEPNTTSKATGKKAGAPQEFELLQRLRVQDILLLQNVALHVFKGKVYGQSLRKGLTKIHLLHRRKLFHDDEGGYYRSEDLFSRKPKGNDGSRRNEKRKRQGDNAKSKQEELSETGKGTEPREEMESRLAKDAEKVTGSPHPQLEKTRRVAEWVINFVGAPQQPTAGRKDTKAQGETSRKTKRGWDVPPDDTQ